MTINTVWVRLIAHFLIGFSFLIISVAVSSFLNYKDVGHRTFLKIVVIFTAVAAASSFDSCWNYATGYYPMRGSSITTWVVINRAFWSVFAAYLTLKNRPHLLITLRVTEEADRRRKDLLRDAEQLRLYQQHFVTKSLELSSTLVLKQQGILREARKG